MRSHPVLPLFALAAACSAPAPARDTASAQAPAAAAAPAADSIVLERGACFGPCPAYRVRLARTGGVLFTSLSAGDSGRVVRDSVAPARVDSLLAEARRIGVPQMPEDIAASPGLCPQRATDHQTVTVEIHGPGAAAHRVVHYLGCYDDPKSGGTPRPVPPLRQLAALEARVDSVAGTARWAVPPSR